MNTRTVLAAFCLIVGCVCVILYYTEKRYSSEEMGEVASDRCQDPLVLVWEFRFETCDTTNPYFALEYDKIYAHQSSDVLYCLSAKTGKLLWTQDIDGMLDSPLTVIDGSIYFVSEKKADGYRRSSSFHCLDAETGTLRWEIKGGNFDTSFTVYNGRIYVYNGSWQCLDAATGKEVWSSSVNRAFYSPAVGDGKVVIGAYEPGDASSKQYHIYCLDAATGSTLWVLEDDNTYSAVAVYSGKIYNFNAFGVQCIDLGTSEVLWRTELGKAYNSFVENGKVYSTPWWSSVFCLDADTGTILWKYDIVGKEVEIYHPVDWVGVSLTPEVADGKIYTGSQKKNPFVYCLDAETGELIWRYEKGNQWYSAPIVTGNRLYYAVKSGILCFEISNSGPQ